MQDELAASEGVPPRARPDGAGTVQDAPSPTIAASDVATIGGLRTELLTPEIRVYPGLPAEIRFSVANTTNVVDRVRVGLPKVNRAWLSLPREDVALFPEASAEITVLLTVPESHPAGRYRLLADLSSVTNPEWVTTHPIDIIVAGTASGELTVRPSLVTAGRRAKLTATVTNDGNRDLELTVTASDPARALEFVIEPHYVSVPAGERAEVAIETVGRRPFFGGLVSHAVTVTAEGSGQELAAATTVIQKPWIPRGAATIAMLAAIVAGWALIFKFGISKVVEPPSFGKDAPADLLVGQNDLDRSAVAGTMRGAVVAETTGAGVPRVIVEAHRVGADAPDATELPAVAASAATEDDGTYVIEGLLPGRYKLHFTAAGFVDRWYPDASDFAAASEVRVTAAQVNEQLDVALPGKGGVLAGAIALPPAPPGKPLAVTVTVRRRDGDTLGPPLAEVAATPTGTFRLPSLPSPAAYQLVFSAPGYADNTVEVTLEAGEELALDTVSMQAPKGSLAGRVTSKTGALLGGVTVTATKGDATIATTTPTSGEVGVYQLIGLETPGTYVVSFALAGYATQTVSVDLGPGEARAALDIQLNDGTAILRGTVAGLDGQPLGGVTVTATNGEFTLTAQTLSAGAVGAFELIGLRAPATYTLTFTRDGYGTESRRVAVDQSAAIDGFAVALAPSVGSLDGVVRRNGTAVGGVTVTVSDGRTSRTTATASSPPGAYHVGNLVPGTYTITFASPGHAPYTVLVSVVAGLAANVSPDLVG